MLRLLPTVLLLAVWIYAFIDCLNTSENEARKLPKLAWVFVILLFPPVGPIAWLAVGRPRRNAPYGATRPAERRWVAPDDNPEFLKSINERGQRRPEPGKPDPGKEPEDGPRGERDGDRDRDREPGKENGGPEDNTPPAAS